MSNKKGRSAPGSGTIRKRKITRNGKDYDYWEARLTVGYDPGTGKQIQRSFTAKTQKEVRQKLQQAAVELKNGDYQNPDKLTFGNWLTTWKRDYLTDVKPLTVTSYSSKIRIHIRPSLGATQLQKLTGEQIQRFYNDLIKKGLQPKTIHTIHGVVHKCLEQAKENGLIKKNPSETCKLPSIIKKPIAPLDDDEIKSFINAIHGHRYEFIYIVDLFTGMREGEVLGLTWSNVDFNRGSILVDKQLQRAPEKGGGFHLVSLKNNKYRVLVPAPFVMDILRTQQQLQNDWKNKNAEFWESSDLVFTNEIGQCLSITSVYKNFKSIVSSIGLSTARFHDLRHSFAVASIYAGDDIKTIQGNLGHATASFTLDVYGHITNQMQHASAARMESYIQSVIPPKKPENTDF